MDIRVVQCYNVLEYHKLNNVLYYTRPNFSSVAMEDLCSLCNASIATQPCQYACDTVKFCRERCMHLHNTLHNHKELCIGVRNKDRDRSPRRDRNKYRDMPDAPSPDFDSPGQPGLIQRIFGIFAGEGSARDAAEFVMETPDWTQGEGEVLDVDCSEKALVLKQFIGAGTYGVVYEACEARRGVSGNCDYVVKIQGLFEKGLRENFQREMRFSTIASNLGFGPYVLYHCTVNRRDLGMLIQQELDSLPQLARVMARGSRNVSFGITVAEKWDMSLHAYKKNMLPRLPASEQQRQAKMLKESLQMYIDEMHTQRIIHADLRYPNVLINLSVQSRTVSAVAITDFGLAWHRDDTAEQMREWGGTLLNFLYKEIPANLGEAELPGEIARVGEYVRLYKRWKDPYDSLSLRDFVGWIVRFPEVLDEIILAKLWRIYR